MFSVVLKNVLTHKNAVYLISLCFLLFSISCQAAKLGVDGDVNSFPDDYFLTFSQVARSEQLLSPPPVFDSVAFLHDKIQYEKGLLIRNTPRGEQAFHDANIAYGGIAISFSSAFGIEISKEHTPEIYRLLTKMYWDAGDLAVRGAKNYYKRTRPYLYYAVTTCNTEDQKKLSTSGSYPSGHASVGWATALILAEINPANQDAILERGYEIGESRVICGYHWQSDIDAARVVASALVATLHSAPEFQQQLTNAKSEFEKLSQVKSK